MGPSLEYFRDFNMKQINEIQPKKCESGDVVERLRKIFLIPNRSSKSYRQIKVQGRTFFILLVAIYLSHEDVRAVPANDATIGIPHHRISNFDFGPPAQQVKLVSMSPDYHGASLGPDDSEDVKLVKKWRGLYPFEYNPNTLNHLLRNHIEEESDNDDADSDEDTMSTLSESKRAPSYNSWRKGKRAPSYNSWRKGKRSLNNEIKDEDKQNGLPTSIAGKRVPTYNSWRKGKRFLNQLASNEPKDELSEEKKSVEDDVSAI